MIKKINLHFSSVQRGPGRVVENLAKGLMSMGWEVYGNAPISSDAHQGCLQPTQALGFLPRNTLMGPNLFIFPSEWGEFCKRFDHYVVPSDWVRNKYQAFNELSQSTIDVWPVGIDTDIWKPDLSLPKEDVLVYFKSRETKELESVTLKLKDLGVNYRIVEYGKYEEKDLYNACNQSRACILLAGTESQGIAYMQILSMGVPCYVMNKSKFDYFHYKENPVDSTSVPYFNDSCGLIRESFDADCFSSFISNLSGFSPRQFILEEFTLEKSAKKYVDILCRYS